MRYLVVSDSHGDRSIIEDLRDTYLGKVDHMFHCGDSELDPKDTLWADFSVVKGNCDYGPGFANDVLVKSGQDVIFMAHGHLLNVRFDLTQLALKAEEAGANIALFGHTHELGCVVRNDLLILNPGSIRLPRGRINIPSYCLIDSTEDGYQVVYYDRAHQEIPKLTFHFGRSQTNS